MTDVIQGFSNGAYVDSDYLKFYQKLEIITIVKMKNFTSKNLIRVFMGFCKFGKSSV